MTSKVDRDGFILIKKSYKQQFYADLDEVVNSDYNLDMQNLLKEAEKKAIDAPSDDEIVNLMAATPKLRNLIDTNTCRKVVTALKDHMRGILTYEEYEQKCTDILGPLKSIKGENAS